MPTASHHPYRTSIPPLANADTRPLWSVMIPTYNCAQYLAETLKSVLAQDPGPALMQIEVVDDGSQDNPAAVVAEIGGGRVTFYQQPVNVGHIRNFDTCLLRATGQLVHLLHGDDLVYDGFYHKIGNAFIQQPALGAAFCRQAFIDDEGRQWATARQDAAASGILDNWLVRLAVEQRIMTPSIVVPRTVYENVGGFDHRLVCSEDWEMWVRIAAQYPIWYEVETLAGYRMHNNSNTGRHVRNGQDMYYTNMAIDIFQEYLPPQQAQRITKQAKRTYALAALQMAKKLTAQRDHVGATSQVREALRMSRSLPVVRQVIALLPSLVRLASRPPFAMSRQSELPL